MDIKLKEYCTNNSITYEAYGVGGESITIPYIEDNDDVLIIRSSYDTTALVDDSYCRDKVNFMNLIEGQSFGSQFAHIDDNGNLQNSITEILDNGVHPNFILKARYPGYDTEVYPKFFKVSNQTQLDTVITNNVTNDYFLMPFYLNEDVTYHNHQKIIRSFNLLTPPNLESIQIGQYTKLNINSLKSGVTYNPTTFEVDTLYRDSYTTTAIVGGMAKLLDTDLIEMADGSFKTPVEIEVGDMIKTIIISSLTDVDTSNPEADFNINYETLVNTTTYDSKPLLIKKQIDVFTYVVTLTFDDETTWFDVEGSDYLINRNDDILLMQLGNLVAGDKVLLLNTTDENVSYVEKTFVPFTREKQIFSGWDITVAVPHLFLTKNPLSTVNSNSYVQYVGIAHNAPCPIMACSICNQTCASCPKTIRYCIGAATCSTTKCV